jgi:hypothetical protein
VGGSQQREWARAVLLLCERLTTFLFGLVDSLNIFKYFIINILSYCCIFQNLDTLYQPERQMRNTRSISFYYVSQTIDDKEGKLRVLGICDYWTQSILKPFHQRVLSILGCFKETLRPVKTYRRSGIAVISITASILPQQRSDSQFL